jgi:hypothetical protein
VVVEVPHALRATQADLLAGCATVDYPMTRQSLLDAVEWAMSTRQVLDA